MREPVSINIKHQTTLAQPNGRIEFAQAVNFQPDYKMTFTNLRDGEGLGAVLLNKLAKYYVNQLWAATLTIEAESVTVRSVSGVQPEDNKLENASEKLQAIIGRQQIKEHKLHEGSKINTFTLHSPKDEALQPFTFVGDHSHMYGVNGAGHVLGIKGIRSVIAQSMAIETWYLLDKDENGSLHAEQVWEYSSV